jgi:archaellum biogenesis ATPase FlaH
MTKNTKPKARAIRMSSVDAREVNWLWKPWIPLGKITVMDGDPGLGKSQILIDLAARLSTHGVMPDGYQGPIGTSIILSAEDDKHDTIRPRLDAAQADLSKVIIIDEMRTANSRRPIALPQDLMPIFSIVKKLQAKLLIIDPFMAYLEGLDAVKDQEVRKALHRFKSMAEHTQCAMILLRHLNKAGGAKAIYRGGGSIGIIGAARVGLLVAQDPEQSEQGILACSKSNVAIKPPALTFTLTGTPNGYSRVLWSGTSKLTADEIITPQAPEEYQGAVQEAISFLEDCLSEGPKTAEAVKLQAKQSGISERTLKRAKAKLGIKTVKDGFNGHWVWKLPSPPDAELPWPTWHPSANTTTNSPTSPSNDTSCSDAA